MPSTDQLLCALQARLDELEQRLEQEIAWREKWLSFQTTKRRDVKVVGWGADCPHDPRCLSSGACARLTALQAAREAAQAG